MEPQEEAVSFPIQRSWVVLRVISLSLLLLILLVLRFGFDLSTIGIIVYTLYFIFSIRNFSYKLEKKYLHIKQGVINKQERYLPYDVIQHVTVKQGIIDKILGLRSISIENAAEAGGYKNSRQRRKHQISHGFNGNTLLVPGLRRNDAEDFRRIILQKIKDNPISSTKSGL